MLDTLAHDRMSGLGRQRQVDPCLGLAGQTVQSELQAPGSLEFLLLAPLPPISFLASFHINPHHISKPCSNFIVPISPGPPRSFPALLQSHKGCSLQVLYNLPPCWLTITEVPGHEFHMINVTPKKKGERFYWTLWRSGGNKTRQRGIQGWKMLDTWPFGPPFFSGSLIYVSKPRNPQQPQAYPPSEKKKQNFVGGRWIRSCVHPWTKLCAGEQSTWISQTSVTWAAL